MNEKQLDKTLVIQYLVKGEYKEERIPGIDGKGLVGEMKRLLDRYDNMCDLVGWCVK